MNSLRKLVITGGHHTSALPVIAELKKVFPHLLIYWFGHKYSLKGDKNPSLEYKEITKLGLPFYEIKAGKAFRTLDPIRLLKIPIGFVQSFWLLATLKPDAILSFGGYLAVPVVISGWVLRIPSITHEQTVVAGHANKLISKFVKKVLISWEKSKVYFPASKTVYAGLPLRPEIFEIKSSAFNLNPQLPTIYITAGKTGSHKINAVVQDSLGELLKTCNIIHQCGDFSPTNDYQTLTDAYSGLASGLPGKYFVRKFVLANEIGEAFHKSNLVVARAGAHITAEVLALKKPTLFIPIPWVSHNEQWENAQMVENVGLATILLEHDLNKENFVYAVKNTLNNLDRYRLTDPTLSGGSKDSAKIIVNEIERAATYKTDQGYAS